jgi:hypothetical protein
LHKEVDPVGISNYAELIWGIPVTNEDHPFLWDDMDADWSIPYAHPILEVIHYGHYMDDVQRGLLTHKESPRYRADNWAPTVVPNGHVEHSVSLAVEANDAAGVLGLPFNFYDARWYLVASCG